jgi:membrane protease YdiL (CAAX protease family)
MPTDTVPPANPTGDASPSIRLVFFALAIFFLHSASGYIANLALQSFQFFDWYYGMGQVEAARAPGGEVINTRMTLWAAALAFPCWVVCVVVLVRRVRLVPAADIGLTLRRPVRDLLLGIAGAIVLTPLVLGLNIGAAEFFVRALGQTPTEHPLTQAGKEGLLPVEWALVAFLVMVSAPVWEELLFRGVLQRLFTESVWAGHLAVGLALLTALFSSVRALRPESAESPHTGLSLLSAFMPVLFILVMVPVYVSLWWRSTAANVRAEPVRTYPDMEPVDLRKRRLSHAPAVFATALLFGATHSFAWPTPIALFVLGLGLGYLALYTRSLVAPVAVHSFFNGVSFALLLTGWSA